MQTTEQRRKCTRLTKMQINELSIVDAGANRGARVVLMKRDGGDTQPLKEPIMAEPKLDDVQKAAEQAQADNVKLKAELEKSASDGAALQKQLEEVRKQLADAQKAGGEIAELTKRLDAEKAEREELRKSNETLAKSLAAIEAERAAAVYLRKAEEYKHLPATAAELAPLLQAIDRIGGEAPQLAEKVLKAADVALSQRLGQLGYVPPTVSGPEAELESMVKRHAVEKSVSEADAWVAVLATKAGAEAYARARGAKTSN